MCSTPRCIAVDLQTFTSGKYYHFTLSATNKAGLTSFLTSDPFLYMSATPTSGFVLDFDPAAVMEIVGGSSYHMSDIDVLLEGSDVGVSWRGFAHPTLQALYSVALGTTPTLDDLVVPLTFLGGGVSDYVFQDAPLQEGLTYYSLVVAEVGSSRWVSSSNGVLVLREAGRTLQLVSVYDGSAEADVEFQASATEVSAQWFFPTVLHSRLSHYMWGVMGIATETASASGSGSGGNAMNPEQTELVLAYRNVGKDTSGISSVPGLRGNGSVFVSAVRACFATGCLAPVYSDGFRVATPPVPGTFDATYTPLELQEESGTSSSGRLQLTWQEFSDEQLAFYEWSLGTGEEGEELLLPWTRAEWFENQVSVVVNATLSLHYSNRVTLRGFNSAGLQARTSTALLWRVGGMTVPQSSVPLAALVVYDLQQSDVDNDPAASGWRDLVYMQQHLQDIDYVESRSSLSAGWPDLRYMQYNYSISTRRQYMACSSHASLGCGTTFYNAATVSSLVLVEGEKYYFCVQALQEYALHQHPDTPPVLEACSNGVTVDLSPPQGSCVKVVAPSLSELGNVGSGMLPGTERRGGLQPEITGECAHVNESMFQVSRSELLLVWEAFQDVEVFGNAVHASGVAAYSYAIGEQWVGNLHVCYHNFFSFRHKTRGH